MVNKLFNICCFVVVVCFFFIIAEEGELTPNKQTNRHP